MIRSAGVTSAPDGHVGASLEMITGPSGGGGRPFDACHSFVKPVMWSQGSPAAATAEKRKGGKEILYQCPIYTCPPRAAHGTQLKNYISSADLRSEDHANKWILRAVCLLTTTD